MLNNKVRANSRVLPRHFFLGTIMSFIASNVNNPEESGTIANDPFYPDLTVSDFKDTMDLGHDIESAQLKNRLISSAFYINSLLSESRYRQNVDKIAALGGTVVDGITRTEFFYKQAVYYHAMGLIVESQHGLSPTKSGHAHAENLEQTQDTYLGLAHKALAMVKGAMTPVSVELI